MKIQYFKATWGMTEGATLRDKFRIIRDAGFDGVETHVYNDDPAEVRGLAEEFGLPLILQIFPLTVQEFRDAAERAVKAAPVKLNSHTGRDKFGPAEARTFWREIFAISRDLGVPVTHETHRHRMLYTPWHTSEHIHEFPELTLTLDLSHWCCVTESMLGDIPHLIDTAIGATRHLHLRVGHEEGPQVADPSAPEYKRHLDAHLAWWDKVKAAHEKRGETVMTVTPEFGPPNYMPTLPHTGVPVADLWKVNAWMRDHMKARWGK